MRRGQLASFGSAALCTLLSVCVLSGAASAQSIKTELIAGGLDDPLFVTHVPGDTQHIYVLQRGGLVRVIDIEQDPPQVLPTPFLDLSGQVIALGERGLLGMAFHPDYANNGYVYVDYTFSGTNSNRISRFTRNAGDPLQADLASEQIVLEIDQPQNNHNGGWLAFGPRDGYLYISSGDGGGADDEGIGHSEPTGNAQDIVDNLLGKLLRIDVDGDDFPGDANLNYAIPPSNPFVGFTGDDEIWAYGLRNPWRNSFDPLTGTLYIADVGQGDWEEIDVQSGGSSGGENYGWRCREGMHDFNFTGDCGAMGTASESFIEPVYEYAHNVPPFGCSITGGEVYRGCAIPALQGHYFFGDFCTDNIWSFDYNAFTEIELFDWTAALEPTDGSEITGITSFGRDALGEIYICSFAGTVHKIVPDGEPNRCDVLVPTVSTWGSAALLLTLITAATILIRQNAGPTHELI